MHVRASIGEVYAPNRVELLFTNAFYSFDNQKKARGRFLERICTAPKWNMAKRPKHVETPTRDRPPRVKLCPVINSLNRCVNILSVHSTSRELLITHNKLGSMSKIGSRSQRFAAGL